MYIIYTYTQYKGNRASSLKHKPNSAKAGIIAQLFHHSTMSKHEDAPSPRPALKVVIMIPASSTHPKQLLERNHEHVNAEKCICQVSDSHAGSK